MSRKNDKPEAPAQAQARITPSYRPEQVRKTAPCQVGCANCGDIRGWIGMVAQRKKLGMSRDEALAQAWRTITDVNPFPATLGRICPHPCEQHCNRAELDEPLAINAMERFLGDYGIQAGLPLPRDRQQESRHWIGVIGAGPSGLSFAYQMARRGYRVTVYDARQKPGGMLRYGVPDYRLPQEVLDAEIGKILDLGVELELDTRVGREVSLESLRERHDCLYLGIGAQGGRGLRIPGADGPSVWKGTDYLERINRGETVDLGRTVLVIGGGNAAIDAARCARRGGAEVTILYRRTRQEMPAIDHEIEDALEEGIELRELAAPTRVVREADGRMTAVEIQCMQLGELGPSGRRRPVPIEGETFTLAADTLIAAIAQVPVLAGLESLDHDGNWLVTDSSGHLSDTVLAGGDAIHPGIAGEAIVQGRRAAEELHAALSGRVAGRAPDPDVPDISAEQVLFATKPQIGAVQADTLPGPQRVERGMAEVASTIGAEEFLAEVERCFSCGSCSGCEACYMYCTAGCFVRVEEARPGVYFTLNLDQCEECGKCIEVCPGGYLEAT